MIARITILKTSMRYSLAIFSSPVVSSAWGLDRVRYQLDWPPGGDILTRQ